MVTPDLTDAARQTRALLDTDQPRAALALASRALRVGEHAHLRLLRARALLALCAEREARRDLRRCLALAPRTVAAYQLLCELALRRRDLVAAEVFLRDARRLAPADPRSAELARVLRGWRQARLTAGDARAVSRAPARVRLAA